MTEGRSRLIGTLSAITGASLFGMLGPLSRFGAEAGVGGVAFTAWRAIFGATFLVLFIAARGQAGPSIAAVRGMRRKGKGLLLLAATLNFTLNTAIFTAFGRAPIALVLMLFYLFPAGVTVVDLVLGRERLTPLRLLALVLSLGGVALVLFGGGGMDASGGLDPLGILLGLLAAACQVVFVDISRHGYSEVPAPAATLTSLLVSATGASILAFALGFGADMSVPATSTDSWPILAVAGIAAAGVSSMLFLTSIRMLGGTRTGILMLLEPVVGVVLAAVWLHEAFTPLQALGGILVLTAAVVLQLGADAGMDPLEQTAAAPSI